MTGTPESLDVAEVAFQLAEARRSATPIDFITSTFPELTWQDARAIARFSDQRRIEDGEHQIGWKLGWTSEVMRTALGIDRPNWGTLWDTQVADVSLRLDDFIHPKVEPELVWRSPRDFNGTVDADELQRAGGTWALGIEVVDPRFPSFGFEALDNTADNSSSAAIRLGQFTSLSEAIDLIEVSFSNGQDTRSGLGSQAMGSPWQAITWLIRSLDEEGLSVETGDLIFTGGLTTPFDVKRGTTYDIESAGLDGATLTFV